MVDIHIHDGNGASVKEEKSRKIEWTGYLRSKTRRCHIFFRKRRREDSASATMKFPSVPGQRRCRRLGWKFQPAFRTEKAKPPKPLRQQWSVRNYCPLNQGCRMTVWSVRDEKRLSSSCCVPESFSTIIDAPDRYSEMFFLPERDIEFQYPDRTGFLDIDQYYIDKNFYLTHILS